MSPRVIRGRDVRFTINGVEFQGFESSTFTFDPPDPMLELRWAGWFDRVWGQAGRSRRGIAGLPIAAWRIGHRQRANGEPIFPRPVGA